MSEEVLRIDTPTAEESLADPSSGKPTAISSINRTAANLRDRADLLHADVTGLHHETSQADLFQNAAIFGTRDPHELLDELGSEFGLSWSTVARMSGVSPTAVRKWRRGEPITPANRHRLSLAYAFVQLLESTFAVADPASWLEMPMTPEASVTPLDMYDAARWDLLIDFAGHRRSLTTVLDDFDADWRANFGVNPAFAVVDGPDGLKAIVETTRRDH